MKKIFLSSIFVFVSLTMSFGNWQTEEEIVECDSVNEELTSKFRFLGEWNANGTPLYLETESDTVSTALISYVKETLPESVNLPESNGDFFGDDVQLNTELTEASKVYLTFVHEGAGWQNTLGYYTYDLSNPPSDVYDIDSMVVIFPNVTQNGSLKPGDQVLLGEFPAQTGIGYFLIARGWVDDSICLNSHIVFSDAHLNIFTSEEYQQQTILLNYEQEQQILLGFEDQKRPEGDNDFNDAVFYITAAPGAIDTTDIPKIPTAVLSGDTTLCDENATATIQVELTGQAPWTIVYYNGTEEIEISGIEDNIYTFETSIKDTISLVSVRDKTQFGITEGQAVIQVSQPKAMLSEDLVICSDDDDGISEFQIDLEGQAPFSLTYELNGKQESIIDILENKYVFSAQVGDEIKLISMSDSFCDGTASGSATVRNADVPTLAVEGNGIICENDTKAVLDLKLSGEGPWMLSYQLGNTDHDLQIGSSEYELEISELGSITFNSLKDAYCESPLNTIINIENKELPAASIEGYTNDCSDDAAIVDIALSGSGPWFVHYAFDGEMKTAYSESNLLKLNTAQNGMFELHGVEDANCSSIIEESLELEVQNVPKATIGEDVSICNNEEATIRIELTGTAPFTFIYSDGASETTITTSESFYEFTTTEFETYTLVSVSDAKCTGEVEGSATVKDLSENIQVEINVDELICFGENVELSLLGDTDALTVVWSTSGTGSLLNSDQLTASYSPGENESGTIEFFAEVRDDCSIRTISKEITIIEEMDASFNISPENDLLTNSLITFTPSNNGYDEYVWDFGDGNSSSATIASTEYSEGGTYKVELSVSLEGCTRTGDAELDVFSKDALYVPNAFNPNAQNRENQVVKVYGNNVHESDFSFKIVNRWGKVMYETNSFTEANTVGWNGINNNNDEELELNVFTYILRGRFIEGESFERTGTVTQVK